MPQFGVADPQLVEEIWLEAHHRSYLFPDDIAKTVTLTAGAPAFAWSAWTEIADNLAVTFSSLATSPLAVSALKIRNTSAADKLYQIEIGYGPNAGAVTVIDPHEFGSGTKHVEGDEQVRFRPPVIPAGQNIYARMKSETGGATANVVFRYHYH